MMENLFSKDEEDEEAATPTPLRTLPFTSPIASLPTPLRIASARHTRPAVSVGRITVSVIRGKLTDEVADVIVSSANPDLDLSKGQTSKATLDAAGASIQSDCDNNYPNGISHGDYAVTGPGNLKCKKIYHGSLPMYGGTTEEKVLHDLVMKCLEGVNRAKETSIAFPGFGTGFLGYPSDKVAEIMFQCIEEFDKKNSNHSLQKVTIVIFYRDQRIFDDFKHEAQKMASKSQGPVLNTQSSGKLAECKFGNVKLTLITGDMAQQKSDVIVNSTAMSLKLDSSGLSKSLLNHAGIELQQEVDSKYDSIDYGDIAVTRGHNLNCQVIYHGCIPSWHGWTVRPDLLLTRFVISCLEGASKYKMASITFPALGTGFLKHPPDKVATNMVQCVRDFQQKYPQTTLKDIRIIVQSHLTNIQQAFQKVMTVPPIQGTGAASSARNHKRGSKGFYEAKSTEDVRPPPYWTHFDKTKTVKQWLIGNTHVLCAVNNKMIYDAITNLFKKTWTGGGSPKVKKIQRLENLTLFEKYADGRRALFRKVAGAQSLSFESPDKISGAGDIVLTKKLMDPVLSQELYSEINEHYLFHGTKHSCLNSIVHQGMDSRLSTSGNFGNGIYAAENSVKSNEYTDKSPSGESTMFLVRMCLGEIYNSKVYTSFCRPPCMNCKDDKCNAHNEFFDSVMGTAKPHRECIVYENRQCYPEYLITYC